MEKSWLDTEEEWNNDADDWTGTTYMSLERMMAAIDKNDMDAFLSELSPDMIDSYLEFIKNAEKESNAKDKEKVEEKVEDEEEDDD
jgi:hypothetical protein